MEKLVIILTAISLLLFGIVCELPENNTKEYPLTTIVVELDKANDIVVCEDFNGNLWEFYETDDWFVGDICSIIMNDNGTDDIRDDVIIYCEKVGEQK